MRIRDFFLEHGTALRVRQGESVRFRGGSRGLLSYIARGQIELHASSSVGQELAVEVLRPGDLVGLGSLAHDGFHKVDAMALTDCELLTLKSAKLQDELSARGEVCFAMLQYTVGKLLRRTDQLQEPCAIQP